MIALNPSPSANLQSGASHSFDSAKPFIPAATDLQSEAFEPGNKSNEGQAAIELARRAIDLFTDRTEPTASIAITSSDDNALLESALVVARWMEQNFDLNIGWWSHNPNRFGLVCQRNHFESFNVDLQPVSLATQAANVDMLIIDQLSNCDVQSLQALDDNLDAQIVLGLSRKRLEKGLIDCFDRQIEVEFEHSALLAIK